VTDISKEAVERLLSQMPFGFSVVEIAHTLVALSARITELEAQASEREAGAYEAAAGATPSLGWEAYVVDDAPSYLSDWQRGLVAGQQAMTKAIRALPPADTMAALAARDARVRGAARQVKPLVFDHGLAFSGQDHSHAESSFGPWTLTAYSGRDGRWAYTDCYGEDSEGDWADRNDCEAAAQTDYAARILSALRTPTEGTPE